MPTLKHGPLHHGPPAKRCLPYFISLGLALACASVAIEEASLSSWQQEEEALGFHKPYQLTAGSESNFAPSLSPDGKVLIYTSERQGSKDVWRKKTSGGFAQPITDHSADDMAPVLSRDGSQIAFISRRFDAAGEVHIIAAESSARGERPSQVIAHKDYEDANPTWYPNGKRLLFTSRKAGDSTPQLMTAALADLQARPYYEIKGSQPAVAPDGQSIVYVFAGGLFLFHEASQEKIPLTPGGLIQDGQPSFSADGRNIIFIRYGDDTNDDGRLDADDRPSLWRLALPGKGAGGASTGAKTGLVPEPLTSAEFAAYSPEIRGERLYFAKQTGAGLDIYYLPAFGQAKSSLDLATIKAQFFARQSYHEKNYILRQGAAALSKAQRLDAGAEVAYWGLRYLVANTRPVEATWQREEMARLFPQQREVQALSDLAMLALRLAPYSFPKHKPSEHSPAAKTHLATLGQALSEVAAAADRHHWPRVKGESMLLQGRLLASQGDFFAAQDVYKAVAANYPSLSELQVATSLQWGYLLEVISSKEAARKKWLDLIASYPSEQQYVQEAAAAAVAMATASDEDPVASLLALRQAGAKLAILPALAHRRIAQIFSDRHQDIVAANELRQIVDSYPDAPEVIVEAATKLSQLVEAAGRMEEAEAILAGLSKRLKEQGSHLHPQAQGLYLKLLVRKGEKLLQTRDFVNAKASFQQVLAIDPEDIGASRGLIDGTYELGGMDALTQRWQREDADKKTLTARALYIRGYAATYHIDSAHSPRAKLQAVDTAMATMEAAREANDQIPEIHQTLGWLYYQRSHWQAAYETHGGLAAYLGSGWNTFVSSLLDISLDLRVLNIFASEPPNWLELSIDSYLAAYALTTGDAMAQGPIALNLGHSYYTLGNFKKALHYYLERSKLLSLLPIRQPQAEALMWQHAGRAAFQGSEYELAASLQNKALTTWETLNAEEQIQHSLDALALTLREQGSYAAAAELYSKLLALLTTPRAPSPNAIKTKINLAFCHLKDGHLSRVGQLLEQAHRELTAPRPQEGEASLPRAFYYEQLLLVETLRAALWRQQGAASHLAASYQRKRELLNEQRKWAKDEGGQGSHYGELELAILANQQGHLHLSLGDLARAKTSFHDALTLSTELDQAKSAKVPSDDSLLNLYNLAKVELQYAESGTTRQDVLGDLTAKLMAVATRLNEQALEKKNNTTAPALGKIYALVGLIRTYLPLSAQSRLAALPGPSTTPPLKQPLAHADPLVASLSLMAQQQVELMAMRTPLLALAGTSIAEPPEEVQTLLRSFRRQITAAPASYWPYLAQKALWAEAFSALRSAIESGANLSLRSERLLAREVFDHYLATRPPQEAPALLQDYHRLKFLALSSRSLAPTESFFAEAAPAIEGGSAAAPSWPPAISTLLGVKEPAALQGSLAPGDGLVAIHRSRVDGETWVSFFSSDASKVHKGTIAAKDHFAPAPYRQLLAFLPPLKRLYIVPSEELYRLDWEAVVAGLPGQQQVSLSFLPSLAVLPPLKKSPSKVRLLFGSLGAAAERDEPAKLDSSQLLQLNYHGDKNRLLTGSDLSLFHGIITLAPLELNGIVPGQSLCSLGNDALSLRDLSQLQLPEAGLALFPNARLTSDSTLPYEGEDAWAALWLALYQAGVPSVGLAHKAALATNKTTPPAFSAAFYQQVAAKGLAATLGKTSAPMRSLGLIPDALPPGDASEGLLLQASEAYEDATNDGLHGEAAAALLRMLYYHKLQGQEQDYWRLLPQLVMLYFRLQKYGDALHLEEVVIAHLASTEQSASELAEAQAQAATLALLAERYATSEAYLSQAALYFTNEEEWAQMANIWHYRALNAEKQQQYEQAIKAYQEAITYYEKDDNSTAIAQKYKAIAGIYQIRLNQYDKALSYLGKAQALFSAAHDTKSLAELKIEQANIYISLDQSKRAIVLLQEVLETINQESAQVAWIRTSQNLANAQLRAGHYGESRERNHQTLSLLAAEGESGASGSAPPASKQALLIDALNLKAMLQAQKAQFAEAFASFDAAINMAQQLKADGKLAFLYNNYGFWLRESGQIKESISLFEKALAIDERLAAKKDIAFDLRNLGLSTLVLGHTSLAKQYLERSLALSRELGVSYNTIYCHFGLADIARRAQQLPAARKHLQAALAEAEGKNITEFRWKALAALAKTFMDVHPTDAKGKGPSEQLLAQAVALLELSPPGLKRQSSPTLLSSEVGAQAVYEAYVTSLMARGEDEKAWTYGEKAKLRRIVDTLGNERLNLKRRNEAPLLASFHSLQEKVGALKGQLLNPQLPAVAQADLKAHLSKALVSYGHAATALKSKDPQAYHLYTTATPTSREVAALLPADTAMITYEVHDEATYIWVQKAGGPLKSARVAVAKALLQRKIEDFRLLLENLSTTRYLGNDLYKLLLAPIAKELTGIKHLVIVPHLWLHHLAFAALNYRDGYLLDHFSLSYLESSAFLAAAVTGNGHGLNRQSPILALANPPIKGKAHLAFAEKEVAAISRYFPRVDAYVGAHATKDLLLQARTDYEVVHLATHGSFDVNSPAESRLLFGEPESANLSAGEAFSLGLSPTLVTLSACESALSVLTSGEDILSLQRGFFYLGAKAVVASLWRIDDVTSGVVMKRFYRHLAQGAAFGEALRQSQLVVKELFPHPAYWAGFKLTGRYQ